MTWKCNKCKRHFDTHKQLVAHKCPEKHGAAKGGQVEAWASVESKGD